MKTIFTKMAESHADVAKSLKRLRRSGSGSEGSDPDEASEKADGWGRIAKKFRGVRYMRKRAYQHSARERRRLEMVHNPTFLDMMNKERRRRADEGDEPSSNP